MRTLASLILTAVLGLTGCVALPMPPWPEEAAEKQPPPPPPQPPAPPPIVLPEQVTPQNTASIVEALEAELDHAAKQK